MPLNSNAEGQITQAEDYITGAILSAEILIRTDSGYQASAYIRTFTTNSSFGDSDMRKPNIVGGGAQTNLNGLKFERNTSLLADIEKTGRYSVTYGCDNNPKYRKGIRANYAKRKTCGQISDLTTGKMIAQYFEQDLLYSQFLDPMGVNHADVISYKLKPDGCLVIGKTAIIIEKKYQAASGSVDEKLQTCDFKKQQYEKLFNPIGYEVRYIYLLNSWFKQPKFNDVFAYIKSVGCEYYIGMLPLKPLGL